MVGWWVQVAWATCTGAMPCEVGRVDADCAPVDGPATAGEPMFLTASCVESVCCAGSAESCTTSYRPFDPEVWRQDGDAWVLTGLRVAPAGTCGDAARYVLTPPGGMLRIDPWTVQVDGEVPQTPTPWPPGFPTLADGLHQRVSEPAGSAEVVAEHLDAALRKAGWEVDPQGIWASREGVLVRFVGHTITWSTHRIPVGSWWTADAPCPVSTRLVERYVSGATEHACLGPGDVLDGPYTRVGDGGGSGGWYASGELDGDWLELHPASFTVGSYVRGVPSGSWEMLSSGVLQGEGRYVDGAKDGTWTHATWGQGGLETEVVEWCRGVRCGAYRRTGGASSETGSYRDDLRQGLWQSTFDGLVVFEGSYDHDHPVGVHRKTQSNGLPFSVEVWDAEGRQDGVWLQYDALGRVVRRDRYRHGVLRRSREWVEDDWGLLRGRRPAQ